MAHRIPEHGAGEEHAAVPPCDMAASSGAPRHITMAATVMSCPAVAALTASDVLISLGVPGTTMTPVPMTK